MYRSYSHDMNFILVTLFKPKNIVCVCYTKTRSSLMDKITILLWSLDIPLTVMNF